MKKHFFALLSILIISSASIAQVETFDLSKFKLPYLKYQSLNLNFNTSNQIQGDSWKDTSDYNFNYSNIYSYLSLGGYYYMYLNTPNEQSIYSLGSEIGRASCRVRV